MLLILRIPFLLHLLSFPRGIFEDLGQVRSMKLRQSEGTDTNVVTPTPSKNTIRAGNADFSIDFPASDTIYRDTSFSHCGMERATKSTYVYQ